MKTRQWINFPSLPAMKPDRYGFRRLFIGICWLLAAAQLNASDTVAHPQDPWEDVNRVIFSVNEGIDRYLLRPVAKTYRFITPDRVEVGVSNLFDNLLEVRNIVNDVLQGKWSQAGNDSGRLLVNSTIGMVGLFDVARYIGLPKSEGEDFGQTLAVWGVKQGPYLVLPFFGSSSVRQGLSFPVDTYTGLTTYIDHVPTRNTVRATGIIDQRANLLKVERLISGDKYAFIREAYLQRREYLINDGEVVDDFGQSVSEYP